MPTISKVKLSKRLGKKIKVRTESLFLLLQIERFLNGQIGD